MLYTYQLQLVLAVGGQGSYTAAARRLHLTQPAVSRQIRLLQEQLGVTLFRRVGRKMLPTHAGERLVEIAHQVLALSRRVEQDMALMRGEVAGVLRVGGSGAPAWHVLGRLLSAFRTDYPVVGFRLEWLPPDGAGRALREGCFDLLLLEERIEERGLVCELLVEMETVVAVPRGGRWDRRKRLPLGKLAETTLILPAPGTSARRFLEEYMAGRDISLPAPMQSLEVPDPGAALPLVAAGLGAALLPAPLLPASMVSVRSLVLWPGFSWPLYIVRRATSASQLEEIFWEFALGEGQALLR